MVFANTEFVSSTPFSPFSPKDLSVNPAKKITITSEAHLVGQNGRAEYLPLCAKASFLKLLEENDGLLDEYIRHALRCSNGADVVIFIADGEVMECALRAMGRVPVEKARKIVGEISMRLRALVDDSLARLACEDRIAGVIHWSEVTACPRFQTVLATLEKIMTTSGQEGENASIQAAVKMLVKNLFTQRTEKARSKGVTVSSVYIDGTDVVKPNRRYGRRYAMLERSCLLELTGIISGLTNHAGQRFTEMRYLTTDPRGMTFISECAEKIRVSVVEDLAPCGSSVDLVVAAAERHGITFARPSL